jgi:arginine decarboxylase
LNFSIQDARQLYGIENWGAGYFNISETGHLVVRPVRNGPQQIEIKKVIDTLMEKGFSPPFLLRFPQLVESQIRELYGAFARAIEEFKYRGEYRLAFPMKVNQKSVVIESAVTAGTKFKIGLEVGSKPELLMALGMGLPSDTLLICNGFKDQHYLQTAFIGKQIGNNVFVIIEKPYELEGFLKLAKRCPVIPSLGFRLKLFAKGSGRWEKSGGFKSKFGMSTAEMLSCVEMVRAAGLIDNLKMLHFHIGSQITEIRRIKNAIKEASRIYAKSLKAGLKVSYLNVGGGLGVDYDGSKTSSDASVNYSIQEFANDVVYSIQDICDQENVAEPIIVTESGRAVAAYHALLVTNVVGAITDEKKNDLVANEQDPQVIVELSDILRSINVKNHREYYHDALQHRDELFSLFDLGYLSLEDRAKGEELFWQICRKAVRFAKTQKYFAEEFEELEKRLAEKYICNFSVFQSIPDSWALEQLFPIIPIHQLDKPPTKSVTLVDITCDSDGEIDKFVDLKDIKEVLEVHELDNGQPYYIAILLLGAYQDVMGDFHNLFGGVNEMMIFLDEKSEMHILSVAKGNSVNEISRYFGYDNRKMTGNFQRTVDKLVEEGKLEEKEGKRIIEQYRKYLEDYPYLHGSVKTPTVLY